MLCFQSENCYVTFWGDLVSLATNVGEGMNATTGAPVPGGSFRYAYDGIGNRTSAQEGSSANLLRYSANSLNQYASVFTPGVIPIRGRADAGASVAVTATVAGVSTTYRPARDGQDFSLDIPVDNSAGPVTAHIAVDAVRRDGTPDLDLRRRLSGDYAVPAAAAEAPTYDADGNLLTYDGWTYAWDGGDRLASAARGTTRLEFNYDYLGRRFEKKVYENSVLVKHQRFVYDGFRQIAEYDALSNHALVNTYVWQPAGLDVPLLRNGGEFYVSDANKNIVALLGANGQVADTYLYNPFGYCAHAGASDNPFRFSSEYFDAETGLVYYNYRYYAPSLGRWISRDPAEEEGGILAYSILNNNTINEIDDLGLWQQDQNNSYTYIAEIGDTLAGLANKISGDEKDSVCLWPVKVFNPGIYPNVHPCDKYNVENLKNDWNHEEYFIATQDLHIYHRGRIMDANNISEYIMKTSKQGAKPISKLWIDSHANPTALGGRKNKYTNKYASFTIEDFTRYAQRYDTQNYALAKQKKGPSRCWFSRNAKVYFAACKSASFASSFASVALRKGAFALGTEYNVDFDQRKINLHLGNNIIKSLDILDNAAWVKFNGGL